MSREEEVIRIAKLAKLDIEQEKLDQVAVNFAEILEHFKRLGDVDTDGVEPVYHASPDPGDSMSEDSASPPSIRLEEIVENAPQSRDNQFRVPKVIE